MVKTLEKHQIHQMHRKTHCDRKHTYESINFKMCSKLKSEMKSEIMIILNEEEKEEKDEFKIKLDVKTTIISDLDKEAGEGLDLSGEIAAIIFH